MGKLDGVSPLGRGRFRRLAKLRHDRVGDLDLARKLARGGLRVDGVEEEEVGGGSVRARLRGAAAVVVESLARRDDADQLAGAAVDAAKDLQTLIGERVPRPVAGERRGTAISHWAVISVSSANVMVEWSGRKDMAYRGGGAKDQRGDRLLRSE